MWSLRSVEHASVIQNTGTQKWFSIVQYSCTSIWDLKYTFSGIFYKLTTNANIKVVADSPDTGPVDVGYIRTSNEYLPSGSSGSGKIS